MERIFRLFNCLNCSETESELFIKGLRSIYSSHEVYDLRKCLGCNLVTTFPIPSRDFLKSCYENVYSYDVHQMVKGEKRIRARKLIKQLNLFNELQDIGEIGSGSGEFALEISQYVKSYKGCDINTLGYVNLPDNVEIFQESDSDFLNQNKAAFDVFVLSHTLEHMLNPVETLKGINAALKADGTIVLIVPNISEAPVFLKRYWGYWQVPVHISHFDIYTITDVLNRAGFKLLDVMYRRSDFMEIGSRVMNLLNLRRKEIKSYNRIFTLIIGIISLAYTFTYNLGKQDLIIVAKKSAF